MNKHSHTIYFALILILTILGIADTIYLCISHYRIHTDVSFASFCALSKAVNCDTVSQSSYAVIGGIPLSYYGLLGYSIYLSISLVGYFKKSNIHWVFLQLLGTLLSIVSIILGYISAIIIKAYCLMCVLTYMINFLLFYFPWSIRNKLDKKSSFNILKEIKQNNQIKYVITTICIIGIILISTFKLFVINYWEINFKNHIKTDLTNGITQEGRPWIGATTPTLTIEEFGDYQCTTCIRQHFLLRQLVQNNPDKIRLIHHQYPLDHNYNPVLLKQPFHIGSGELSLIAIHSLNEGNFWETNDRLFDFFKSNQENEIDLLDVANKIFLQKNELVKALNTQRYKEQLYRDIELGLKLGVTATPSYLINGKIYKGSIPPDILQEFK